ncbi:MAG: cyclic nucleotide-binding domain-containing protein [Pseudomonadota bacterium]
MMMEPYGGAPLTDALIHAGFGLSAVAFLVRDILWLRCLSILANLAMGYAAYRALPDPRWIVVIWAATFIAINVVHSIWLISERHLMRLTEEEKRLKESTFGAVDPVLVRKLLRRGQWRDLKPEDCLVRQGIHLNSMYLIASGQAAVLLGDHVVTQIGPGKFVGEISYLTGDRSTATVVATEPLRCLVWRCSELDKLKKRRPEVVGALQAAIGLDLSAKIASHNVRLAQA